MAECRPQNYPKLKDYKPSRFMLPTCHYDAAKADRAVTFIENLRHTKGKWAGKRFWLLPWQEQIIRDVFGIVDERGNRQFRTAYVEIGKKNGKSSTQGNWKPCAAPAVWRFCMHWGISMSTGTKLTITS